MLTHTEPSPIAMLPPAAGAPNSIVLRHLVRLRVDAVDLAVLRAQHPNRASPMASAFGRAPTSIDLSTRFVCGSIRSTRFSAGHASHSAVSPNVNDPQSVGTRNSAPPRSPRIDARHRPMRSVTAHTLSALAAIASARRADPNRQRRRDLAVLASTRTIDFAPHAPAHTLPNAFTAPPHGSLDPDIGSASFFSFARASIRTSPSFVVQR